MTSVSLHPAPSSRTVILEQFRAVGLALRNEAFFFVGALTVLSVLVIVNAVRFLQTRPSGHIQMGFTYGAAGAIPICFMALLIPFGVWRTEDPSRRAYHWSMPMARGPHTIVKLLSGWVWMMIAAAVYLLFIVMLATVVPMITGESYQLAQTPAWEWVVAFTATTLTYALASIAVVASDHAWRWIGGLFFGYWILIGVLSSFGMQEVSQIMRTVVDGTYGLNAALFGSVDHTHARMAVGVTREMMRGLSMSNWLIAMPLWIVGSGIAVTIASYRHRD